MSTWDIPRFVRSYDETLDDGLIVPRGLADTVASLIEQTGSRVELADRAGRRHQAEILLHGRRLLTCSGRR